MRHHGHDAVVETANGIAVGLGARDLFGADQAGGARQVQDHDLLPHIVGHLLRDDAGGDIDGARRRQRHDHLDRPVGITCLRRSLRSRQEEKRENKRQARAHACLPVAGRGSVAAMPMSEIAPDNKVWQSAHGGARLQ